jgi:hypothetical protein
VSRSSEAAVFPGSAARVGLGVGELLRAELRGAPPHFGPARQGDEHGGQRAHREHEPKRRAVRAARVARPRPAVGRRRRVGRGAERRATAKVAVVVAAPGGRVVVVAVTAGRLTVGRLGVDEVHEAANEDGRGAVAQQVHDPPHLPHKEGQHSAPTQMRNSQQVGQAQPTKDILEYTAKEFL